MTSRMTPLGGVHDDERMLDQLASRSYAGDDQLGVALNAWAKRMDAEASAATARADIGELVRRHTAAAEIVEAAEPATTIRIRASRLLATLGGVGVAATALGIALANGYNVPGFPSLTPSQSATSISNDQQLLNNALEIRKVVLTQSLPRPVQMARLQQLQQLRDQATDPAIRRQLERVQEEVERAMTTPSSSNAPSSSSTSSPSAIPKLTLPDLPSVTTPAPETTPAPSERVTSSEQPDKPTAKKPSEDTSSSGSIPPSTTTPAPTSSTPPPPSPSSTDAATPTSKSRVRPGTRTVPSRTRTAVPRASSSAPVSASAPAGDAGQATGAQDGAGATSPAEG